jgi:uncharacterized membrane protein YebE (DUF533 family)
MEHVAGGTRVGVRMLGEKKEDAMRRTVIALAGGLVISLPPAAWSVTLEQHERHEDKRIHKGEKRGSLTDKEAAKLEDKQDTIDEERAAAKADGKVTKRERKSIRHEQKELSQDIYRKKHNKKHE